MLQIKNTLGGGKPEGLYVWKKSEIGSELKEFNKSVSTLPFSFTQGSAVIYNGEIHILGSNVSADRTKHYKWNGTSWTEVSTLPYSFYGGAAVVFNNEIHILGSGYDSLYYKYHYKYDGTSWTSVSTLPYSFYQGSAVVYNNGIHILGGGGGSTKYYKWDGTSWTSVSTLSYGFTYGSVVVFDNGIHTLGSGSSSYATAHYLVYGYAPVYTFLDYIVSDKETAYPDGGEKGGYWYEKVGDDLFSKLTGASKVAIDEFTSASTMNITPTSKPNISHSLGVKPKGYLIYTEDELSVTYGIKSMFWLDLISGTHSIACHYYSGSPYAFEFAGNGNIYNSSITEDSIILINNSGTSSYVRRFQSGKKYKILTWA